MNLLFILSRPINYQANDPAYVIFYWKRTNNKQIFNVVLQSDVCRPIPYKLGKIIETTELYILIRVLMTFVVIQGHSCMKNRKLLRSCSWNFHNRFRWYTVSCHRCVEVHARYRLVGLVVKASASRAEDLGIESRLRRDFLRGQVIPVTSKLALQWLPCQAPGVIGSVLELASPLSVYCDWVRLKVWSVSQSGSTCNCLRRSVPEIHCHVAGMLSNQQTTNRAIFLLHV